jgi:hypothetical protein
MLKGDRVESDDTRHIRSELQHRNIFGYDRRPQLPYVCFLPLLILPFQLHLQTPILIFHGRRLEAPPVWEAGEFAAAVFR